MIIATHNGPFHADDVVAIAILKQVFPDAVVIRTRDPSELASADLRVDVGGDYNPSAGDFDHHQGNIPTRHNGIPYAACGLVWRHFGTRLVSQDIVNALDRYLFQAIDATDNGVEFPKIHHELRPYTFSSIIDSYNQQWNEVPGNHFELAVELATHILQREIQATRGSLEAREFVRSSLKRYDGLPYVVLEEFRPWKSVVIEESDKLFCLHPRGDGSWNVFAVPKEVGGFVNRKNFPSSWAGLTDNALASVTGVKDAVFCHKNLFLCVAKSKEGALELVHLAIR